MHENLARQLRNLEFDDRGYDYVVAAERAGEDLADLGLEAIPVLVEALEDETYVDIPVKCFDQGMYIGDYAHRSVGVSDVSIEALRRIGMRGQNIPTHTALIDCAEQTMLERTRKGLCKVIHDLGIYWHPSLRERRQKLLNLPTEPPKPPPAH